MPIASYFKRDKVQVLEQGATTLYVKLTVGATGAVSAKTGYGMANVARNSAGNYTITLDRKFKKLLDVSDTVIQATPQGLKMTVKANNIASAGAVQIEYNTDGGVATELSIGTIVLFAITVADTSLAGGV